MKDRFHFLDGLKGIACILVFVHHFLLIFFPATYNGDASVVHVNNVFELGMSQSPFNFIFNGNFMVTIFLTISSFIFSYKVMSINNKKVGKTIIKIMIKRYLRISLAVFIVSAIVLGLATIGTINNIQTQEVVKSWWLTANYITPLNLNNLFYTSFVSVPFYGDGTYSTAFWMLNYLVVGIYVSVVLGIIGRIFKVKAALIFIAAIIFAYFTNGLALSIVLGSSIAYIYINFKDIFFRDSRFNVCIAYILIFVGLFLGGYPSGVIPTNIYKYLNFTLAIPTALFYHALASFILIYALFKVDLLQKILSCKLFLFLGNISFGIYLLHIPILFSVNLIMFNKFYWFFNGEYILSVCFTFVLILVMLIVVATVYTIIEQKFIVKLVNKLVGKNS